jgi:formylglycine-generating enzyme required for sulfatase activity
MSRLTRSLTLLAFVLVPALPLVGGQGGKDKEDPLIAGMKFVKVPRGTFWMGWDSDEKQSKRVEIKQDFELAAYLVTQEQWQAVMGYNPSWFSRTGGGKDKVKSIVDADLQRFPVENVTWYDAQQFLRNLNDKQKGKGWLYRLPSEAEWEYACRNAATTREACSFDYYFDQPTNDLSSTQANFDGNRPAGKGAKGPYLKRPTRVGSYAPNQLKLYDMHGNVLQWCGDVLDDAWGECRVFRGGGWFFEASYCCAANRITREPTYLSYDLGFRLARIPVGGK